MAGGSGTRFWPASRRSRPKQFLPLADGVPLLQATLDRLRTVVPDDQVWIVTNPAQLPGLRRLLPKFRRDRILVEPEPRDTAPCLALAVAAIGNLAPQARLLFLPADHRIAPKAAFRRVLRRGLQVCADDRSLVVFGIRPTFPATGFGYIQRGAARDEAAPPAHTVRRFREKPDLATAKRMLVRGDHLWNSGMLAGSVAALRAAMAAHCPALHAATEQLAAALARRSPPGLRRAFAAAPRTSIDYALLEHCRDLTVVEAALDWDDVGSLPALAAVGSRDRDGNAAVLPAGASLLPLHSQRNLVYAEGPRTVALFGVEDLVVVAVDDAVLVCSRARANDLKQFVDHARNSGRSDLL
jgi:mannose-1-phosphate guanylyltransferase